MTDVAREGSAAERERQLRRIVDGLRDELARTVADRAAYQLDAARKGAKVRSLIEEVLAQGARIEALERRLAASAACRVHAGRRAEGR